MQHTLKNPKMHHYVDNNISSYQFKSVAIKTLFTLESIVENISRLRYCYMNCSVKGRFYSVMIWFNIEFEILSSLQYSKNSIQMQIFHSKTLNSIQDFFRFQHQENSRDSTESCVLKVGISCIPTIHCIRVVFWLVKKIFEGSIKNVTVNPKRACIRLLSLL